MSFLSKIFGDANEKYLKKIQLLVEKINGLESEFEGFSNTELKEKTAEFKSRLKKGETLDDLLPEAFALVRESAKRTLNQRHFDVQLLGGIALHQGRIAEMKTGEGKTLAATLPAYLNALEEKGVHIVTVNDYLAKRDVVWMGQIYHLLGLSVGCIVHDAAFVYDPTYQGESPRPQGPDSKSQILNGERDKERDLLGGFKVIESYLRPVSRKQAYLADITYGTNNEFGFDYLRDNMAYDLNDVAQRGFNFAIIDEIDSILIDEARTPLIISTPDTESSKWYKEFAKIVPRLDPEKDYEIDEKIRTVTLTEQGIDKIEKMGGMVSAIEKGYVQQQIQNSAYDYQRSIEIKDRIVVGVNEFKSEKEIQPDLLKVNPIIGEKQINKLSKIKTKRNNSLVSEKLENIRNAANSNDNLMPFIVEAVKEYATLGEICGVLREEFGEYQENVIL